MVRSRRQSGTHSEGIRVVYIHKKYRNNKKTEEIRGGRNAHQPTRVRAVLIW